MNVDALTPAAFFDLEASGHPDLFAHLDYVWQALDRLPEYLETNGDGRIDGEIQEGAWLIGSDISIGVGTVVEPGAYIKGPCIIGRNSQIRHGAYLRGNVLVGDDCVVGHATEAKGAIFLNKAKAGHFAYVGDSILGIGVNLGAGTKLANLRLDGKEVDVRVGREAATPTGRRKLGAILGDATETGCNSVTNPGTFVGPNSVVWPSLAIHGYHPPGSNLQRPGRSR